MGLSPAAAAGVSVLLTATLALGVAYYIASQRSALLELQQKTTNLAANKQRTTSKVAKQSNARMKKASAASSSAAPSAPPPPMPVRILFGTQTGTAKRAAFRFAVREDGVMGVGMT